MDLRAQNAALKEQLAVMDQKIAALNAAPPPQASAPPPAAEGAAPPPPADPAAAFAAAKGMLDAGDMISAEAGFRDSSAASATAPRVRRPATLWAARCWFATPSATPPPPRSAPSAAGRPPAGPPRPSSPSPARSSAWASPLTPARPSANWPNATPEPPPAPKPPPPTSSSKPSASEPDRRRRRQAPIRPSARRPQRGKRVFVGDGETLSSPPGEETRPKRWRGALAAQISNLAAASLSCRLDPNAPPPLVVAFSGGGDSLALLIAAKAWAEGAGRRLVAVTVDHRLQAAGAEWARWCEARCRRLGVAHRTMIWTGGKPATGLSAAARHARHGLIADAARQAGACVILMGHTADDRLEARSMRAAGGSVPDPREWSPSPVWPQGRGLFILRPLIEARRAAIRAALAAAGETWIEDPANRDPRHARAPAPAGSWRAASRVRRRTPSGRHPRGPHHRRSGRRPRIGPRGPDPGGDCDQIPDRRGPPLRGRNLPPPARRSARPPDAKARGRRAVRRHPRQRPRRGGRFAHPHPARGRRRAAPPHRPADWPPLRLGRPLRDHRPRSRPSRPRRSPAAPRGSTAASAPPL